jgi:hypothetical protein
MKTTLPGKKIRPTSAGRMMLWAPIPSLHLKHSRILLIRHQKNNFMKPKLFSAAIAALLISCSNSEDAGQNKDSANTLQDTFPANGLKDSMSPDSNPADATHVDSLDATSR